MCFVMSTCPSFRPAVCWSGKTSLSLDKVLIKFYLGDLLIYNNKFQVRQWLRHCATNREVSGSIPDGVIGIFH